jgi:hypothetical protein
MGKLNLSEAAKEILDASVASKRGSGEKFGQGRKLAADEQGHEDIGGPTFSNRDTESIGRNAAKSIRSATPPGATPPVGSAKDGVGITKATGPQDSMGRSDLTAPTQDHDQDQNSRVDRQKAKTLIATYMPNKNAPAMHVPEETEQDEEDFLEDEEEFEEDDIIDEAKHEDEAEHEDEKQDKAMMKKMMKKKEKEDEMKEKMKEDIDALLQGQNLSEEFVSKASTIFESAVYARASEVIADVEAELVEEFQVAVEQIKEELADKVDAYLNYMVEEWMKENQLAIEKGLRSEIVEEFIDGLRNLFVEHYIDVPTEKVDVVEELAEKVAELENALNEEINRGVALNIELNEHKKYEAIYAACEGLTQTQVEKLKSLTESVEFTTEDEFADKLNTLKEAYFRSDVKSASNLSLDDEVLIEDEVKPARFDDPSMEAYAKTISKTVIK